MDELQKIVRGMMNSNQQERDRFARLASRTVGAITKGTFDELQGIVNDAAGEPAESDSGGTVSIDLGANSEVGSQPVEAGNSDRNSGVQVFTKTPV